LAFFDRIDLKISKLGAFDHNDQLPSIGDYDFFESSNHYTIRHGQAQIVVIPAGQDHVSSSVIKVISGYHSVKSSDIVFKFTSPYVGSPWVAVRLKKSGNSPRGGIDISVAGDPFSKLNFIPSFNSNSIWYQKRLPPLVNTENEVSIRIGYDDPGGEVSVINGQALLGDFEIDCFYIGFEKLIDSGVYSSNISGNWWTVNESDSSSPYFLQKIKDRISYKYATINLISLDSNGYYQRGMGYWNSIDDQRIEGWRNFIIYNSAPDLKDGPDNFSFIVPIVSPGAAGKYYIWEKSSEISNIPDASLIPGGNSLGSAISLGSSLAVKCYIRRPFIQNGKITTPDPSSALVEIVALNASNLSPNLNNTSYVATDFGSGVKLELPNRVVGILIDQSGSMSWNDPDNVRFSIANEIIDRFSGGYPGNLSFTVSSFSGVPINIDWFAALESDLDSAGSPVSAQAAFSKSTSHNFAGVQIVRKADVQSSSSSDGDIILDGYQNAIFDSGLDPSKTYYYSIYPKDIYGRTYAPTVISVKPDAARPPAGVKNIVGKEYKGTGVPTSPSMLAVWHMNEAQGTKAYSFASSASSLDVSYSGSSIPVWLEKSDSPYVSQTQQYGKGSGIRLNGISQWLEHSETITHSGNYLSFGIWIKPLRSGSSVIGGVISSWRWGNHDFIISCNINKQIEINFGGITIVPDTLIDELSWNNIVITFNGLSGVVVSYINNVVRVFGSTWRDSGNDIVNFKIGRHLNSYGAFKVTECFISSEIVTHDFVANNYVTINPDNGDRILVIRNSYGILTGPDGGRLVIKFKRESGPLRLLDQNISGPANTGRYGGDSSVPRNVPIPPGPFNAARSDVSARICFGDDIGPSSIEDGLTIYDSIQGIKDEIVFNDPFGLPLKESELGNIVYNGYRYYFRAFTVDSSGASSLVEDSGMIEYQPSSMGSNNPVSTAPGSVSDLSYVGGDRKIKLSWNVGENYSHDSVLVYYNKRTNPDDPIDYESLADFISSGAGAYPVFCGNADQEEFIHYYGRVSGSTPLSGEAVDAVQSLSGGIDTSMELENGRKVHYAVVLRNADGTVGNPVFIEAIPDETTDNLIKTESPIAIRSYKLETGSISIKFINPVNPKLFFDVGGWLDDRVFFYFRATDIYGRPLEDNFDFIFRTSYDIDSVSGDYVSTPANLLITDDGTADGLTDTNDSYRLFDPVSGTPAKINFKFNELCRFSRRSSLDGYIRVVLDTDSFGLDKLKYVSGLYFSARMSMRRRRSSSDLVGGDLSEPTFSFDTQPIRVWLSNPISVESFTPDQTIVPCSIDESASSITNYYDCGTGSSSDFATNVFNGAYVGRDRPVSFVMRAKYKDGPMPLGSSATIYAFQDDLPSWFSNQGINGCSSPAGYKGCVQFNGENGTPRESRCTGAIAGDPVFGPDFTRTYSRSFDIVPINEVANFVYNAQTGWSEATFQFSTPARATASTIFGYTTVGGFAASAGSYFAFPDPLFINIDAQAPIPDGVDVARQTAYVAVVDPNRAVIIDGNVTPGSILESFTTPVPDGTVVKWEISPLRNGKNRPFYSLIYRNSDEVRDITSSGYSTNVRFGPANNITSELVEEVFYNGTNSDVRVVLVPEIYIIRASVNFGNRTASAWKVVCIYPPALSDGGGGTPATQIVRRTGMFCSLTNGRYSQRMYADGIDYAVFQISRDALAASRDSSSVDERTLASAFVKCYNGDGLYQGIPGAFLSTIPEGKLVEVKIGKLQDYFSTNTAPYWARNVEILHGNLSLGFDANGYPVVNANNTGFNSTFIQLSSDNKTYFAIRSNGFIPKVWGKHNEPTTVKDVGILCEHIHNRPYAAAGEDYDQQSGDAVFSGIENCNNDGFVENCDYDSQIVLASDDKRWLDYDIIVNSETSINSQYGEIPCVSAGSWAIGNPPKLIKFIEPLSIVFAFNEVGGQRLYNNEVVVDGSSVNKLYFAVSFSGRPVPDGTPVYIYACGSSSLTPVASTVQTFKTSENGSWCSDANGNFIDVGTSYAVVELNPLPAGSSFTGTIFAEVRYDRIGSVIRQRICGVKIAYAGSIGGNQANLLPPGGGEGNNSSSAIATILSDPTSGRDFNRIPISNQCFLYDNNWQDNDSSEWTRIADMAVPRAWHVSECINNTWYVFGGLSIYGISIINEKWMPSTNRWDSIASMPTPRFGCSSVSDDRYIYVIGGIESYVNATADPSVAEVKTLLRASNKIERYDTVSDSWTVLSSMPWVNSNGDVVDAPVGDFDYISSGISPLSSAFGRAVIINGNIHVFCGASSVNSDLEPVSMLNRVLIYDNESDAWIVSKVISGLDYDRYARLYPNFAVKGNSIVVFGGSNYRQQIEEYLVDGNVQTRSVTKQFIINDSFAIDTSDVQGANLIGDADAILPDIPFAKDQACQAKIVNDYVVMGGRTLPSQSSPGSPAYAGVQKLSSQSTYFSLSNLNNIPFGRSLSSLASDNSRYAVLSGGCSTGKAPGFVRLYIEVYGEQNDTVGFRRLDLEEPVNAMARLDGISSVDVSIKCYDENGFLITGDINVELTGYIKFPIEGESGSGGVLGSVFGRRGPGANATFMRKRIRRGTKVFPVRLDPKNVIVRNGKGEAKLSGRSEDPLRDISEIAAALGDDLSSEIDLAGDMPNQTVIRQSLSRYPYQIVVYGEVVDDNLYGNTSFVNVSGNQFEESISFPELLDQDEIVDSGDFDFANPMPPFRAGYGGLSATNQDIVPPPFINLGSVLETSQVGVIGPIGDTDLFEFVAPVSGVYTIAITNRGISTLKSKITIFSSNREPLSSGEVVNGVINFTFGGGIGDPTNDINLQSGSKYYVLVSSYDSNTNPNSSEIANVVGEYRLRIAVPLEESNNLLNNNVQGNNDIVYAGAGGGQGSGACPFECPVCIRTGAGLSGLSCSGSNNAICFNLIGVSGQNNDGGNVQNANYVDPEFEDNSPANLNNPQPPSYVPELLDFININMTSVFEYWSAGSNILGEPESPIVQYYSDITWLPQVRTRIFTGNNSYINAKNEIINISKTNPFGCSPVFDAISENARITIQNFESDSIKKSFILITDSDENVSSVSVEDSADEINSLSGRRKSPVVMGLLSLVDPRFVSSALSRANAGNAVLLPSLTGGGTNVIRSSNDIERFVDFSISRSAGSVGSGTYDAIIDLQREAVIINVNPVFEIPSGTDGRYKVSFSNDGTIYSNEISASHGESVSGPPKLIRYIKLSVFLYHPLKDVVRDDAGVPAPEYPKLLKIEVSVNYGAISNIITKPLYSLSSPSQVVISVISDRNDLAKISASASSYFGYEFDDYAVKYHKVVNDHGKVVFSNRPYSVSPKMRDTLIKKYGMYYESPRGGWFENSVIYVRDGNGDIIESSDYVSIPRSGIILLKTIAKEPLTLEVSNESTMSIAVEVSNASYDSAVGISGISYLTTFVSDGEGTLVNQPPLAVDLSISNAPISVYETVISVYTYLDPEGDQENVQTTQVRWYINDIEIEYLRGFRKFNDFNDPSDPIFTYALSRNYAREGAEIGQPGALLAALDNVSFLKIGDRIRFSITPHDGYQFGAEARSQQYTIVDIASSPLPPVLRARNVQTQEIGDIATNLTALFLDFQLFSSNLMSQTNVRWYLTSSSGVESLIRETPLLNSIQVPSVYIYPEDRTPGGQRIIAIGNIIRAEFFIPATASSGEIVLSSNSMIISNIVPRVSIDINGLLGAGGLPGEGGVFTVIQCDYQFIDPDINAGESQSDNSLAYFEIQPPGSVDFIIVDGVDPKTDLLDVTSYLQGTNFRVRAIPYDGTNFGITVLSNVLTKQ
jgi:hypothetical protein